MKMQNRFHRIKEELDSDISESCYYCSKELSNIKYIFVSVDKDRYICGECSEKMDIEVVNCMDY